MPAPIQITVQGRTYTAQIFTGEMEDVANQIQSKKDEIRSLNNHLTDAITSLADLNKQFLVLYIQQTGSFPP